MAYEIEAATIATEAFIRNVADELEMSDEQCHQLEDATVDLPAEIINCTGQSEVNELIFSTIGEITNYDGATQNAMAGAIDFFWQIYNDSSESQIDAS